MSSAQDPLLLDARRILIAAPHPDDESLGCGGLASILAADGRDFHTLFVTDGGASHPNSKSWRRPRLVAERETEAVRALAVLGLADMTWTFLRLRDADMPDPGSHEWRVTLGRVSKLIEAFAPDLLLLPWRRDPHCDHRASWQLLMEATARAAVKPEVLEYAIWLDELGTRDDFPRQGEMIRRIFDVSKVVAAKRLAVAQHLTQTTAMIDDDPNGFRLDATTIARLTGPTETYWQDAKTD